VTLASLWSCLLVLAPLVQDPQEETQPAPSAGEVARLVDEYLAASGYESSPRAWETVLERLLLYGDLRLRHESNFELDGAPNRHRQRVRGRVGANYEVNDQLQLGARLVTGDPDDPKSTHVTLGDGLNSFEVSLDRAFLTWHPEQLEGSRVTGGKFDHAFVRNPVYGELVWDADVQPEGLLFGYDVPVGGAVGKLELTAGHYILLESSSASDAFATVLQVGADTPLGENTRGRAAVGYYNYSNLTPGGSTSLVDDNAGNATIDIDGNGMPDEFASDYGVLNPIVAVDFAGGARPVTVSAEYIKNLRADIDRDEGWAAGVSVGSMRRKGDWRCYYQWQVVQQDAVFSPVSQDDFLLATNHRSHVAGVNYQFADNVGLHLWALVTSRDYTLAGQSDDPQWRVRVDLNVKL
jgi:hypothetical protein